MKERVGFGLFSVGIIVAITGAAKAPETIGQWPDTWPFFVLGALVTTAGLVIWRSARAAVRQEMAVSAEQDPVALLKSIRQPLDALSEDIGTLDAPSINARVDELLSKYVLPFAEVRQRVIDRFGMEKGAEILVITAYGERILNRVWSAAADGHLPESRACLPEARAALEEAVQLIETLEAGA